MGVTYLVLLGVAFLVSSIVFLASNKRQRDVVLGRLNIRRRRPSTAGTPPRSLSPSKKPVVTVSNTSTPEYTDVFPKPTRRFTLEESGSHLPAILNKPMSQLTVDPPQWTKSLAPLDVSPKDLKTPGYTATGFSTEEIAALGDFPDYSVLSGIPMPAPYPEFTIERALPRPYRPFRWPYHQTMSLSKMEPDWWLELENTYVERIKQRQDLYAKHGSDVLDSLPGSEIACKELMEMCLQFLCARYPHYFRLDKEKMIFYNDILKTETLLKKQNPLHVLLNNVPEDFAITLRDHKTGNYFLRAGIICSALGWNLGVKLGMQLHEIHTTVPDYKEKMQFSMDRYFSKKETDKAIQRGSWGLEIDCPLYMPPGDPHEKFRDVQLSGIDVSRCSLRVDWQTLRRLPLSGAIVFNYKAVFTPVESFRDEPYIPALLLKILRDAKPELMKYKSTWHTEHITIPALEAWSKEQVESGIVPADWTPGTLVMKNKDSPPCFQGWEEKWHRSQGF